MLFIVFAVVVQVKECRPVGGGIRVAGHALHLGVVEEVTRALNVSSRSLRASTLLNSVHRTRTLIWDGLVVEAQPGDLASTWRVGFLNSVGEVAVSAWALGRRGDPKPSNACLRGLVAFVGFSTETLLDARCIFGRPLCPIPGTLGARVTDGGKKSCEWWCLVM